MHFLTYKYLIRGKIYSFIGTLVGATSMTRLFSSADYKLIKKFPFRGKKYSSKVGLYNNNKGELIVIRKLNYVLKNINYEYAINDTSLLTLINKLALLDKNDSSVYFPKIILMKDTGNELIIVREFITGKRLSSLKKIDKIKILTNCFIRLKNLSSYLTSGEINELPSRGIFYLLFLYPYYFLKVIIKDRRNISLLFRLSLLFYKKILNRTFIMSQMVLTHRDLNQNNIIISGKQTYIIDLESMLLCHEETDIAITARYFLEETNITRVLKLLSANLDNRRKINNFIGLTIFYTVLIMAMEPRSSKYYMNGYEYLKVVDTKIKNYLEKLNKNYF